MEVGNEKSYFDNEYFLIFPIYICLANDCLKVASQLWKIENQIFEKSFKNLPVGSWVMYKGGIKVVYLGKKISPKTGKKLYVLEISAKKGGIMQIWYELISEKEMFEAKTFHFWRLEPVEMYMLSNGQIFYISKEMINMFYKMGKMYSTVFEKNGKNSIFSPQVCDNPPKIKETSYKLPNGKEVEAILILSKGNKFYLSPEVPLGVVNEVIDFGFSGGEAQITKEMAAKAKPMSLFYMSPRVPAN